MRGVFSNLRFMLMWVVGGVFALYSSLLAAIIIFIGGGVLAFVIWSGYDQLPDTPSVIIYSFAVYSLIGLAFGLIIGSIQKPLLRQKTDEFWQGWRIASIIGGILGVDILAALLVQQTGFFFNIRTLPPAELLWVMALQVLVIPLALLSFCQMFVLARYVRGAWTWVLAHVVAGIVLFSLLMTGIVASSGAFLLGLLLLLAVSTAPMIVTGFAMIWLLNVNWTYYVD